MIEWEERVSAIVKTRQEVKWSEWKEQAIHEKSKRIEWRMHIRVFSFRLNSTTQVRRRNVNWLKRKSKKKKQTKRTSPRDSEQVRAKADQSKWHFVCIVCNATDDD